MYVTFLNAFGKLMSNKLLALLIWQVSYVRPRLGAVGK